MSKRIFDLCLSLFCLLVLAIPILLLALLVKLTSKGPAIYWSKRVGRDNRIFSMPKFRTMKLDTPQLATHLLQDPNRFLTSIGPILRKLSLDEFPQLWSILCGDMSFVGPRPALFNQYDLIEMRSEKGIHHLRPGLTGWAQVNGRDDISNQDKVFYDFEYLQKQSFLFDLRIIAITFLHVVRSKGVKH